MLGGKRVLLCVTGGIAAYKAVELLRLLRADGAEVTVAMTEAAKRFVGPPTFQALSGRPVADDLFAWSPGMPIEHLAIAREADLAIVAPATANVLAKMAAGIADDLVTTALLAVTAPVLVAPAMNTAMLRHPATVANLETLRARGVHVAPPESGAMAAEEAGYGRLADPARILAQARGLLAAPRRDLAGRRILVTAGPTREPVDPVRFLSNRSSGRMGVALAAAAVDRGAEVLLVAGPICVAPPAGAEVTRVETAEEMRREALRLFPSCDAAIMAAAVADFRPAAPAAGKIKKAGRAKLSLELEPAPDILAELGKSRGDRVLVGFAAETGPAAAAAAEKLRRKGLDLVVANDVTEPGAGFDAETNRVEIVRREGPPLALPLLSKREVADRVLDEVAALLDARGAPR